MDNGYLTSALFPNPPKRRQRKELTNEIKKVNATIGPSTYEEICVKGITREASEVSFIFPGNICEKFPATRELYEKLKVDSDRNVLLTLRETHTKIYRRDKFGNENTVVHYHISCTLIKILVL
jgi:hypothetical protein